MNNNQNLFVVTLTARILTPNPLGPTVGTLNRLLHDLVDSGSYEIQHVVVVVQEEEK